LFSRLSEGLRKGVQPKSGAYNKKNATHQFHFVLHLLPSFLVRLVSFDREDRSIFAINLTPEASCAWSG
jgi:hypothetical protein